MHAQVSDFKSRLGVDCRETYTKDGAVLPGKKGAHRLLNHPDDPGTPCMLTVPADTLALVVCCAKGES